MADERKWMKAPQFPTDVIRTSACVNIETMNDELMLIELGLKGPIMKSLCFFVCIHDSSSKAQMAVSFYLCSIWNDSCSICRDSRWHYLTLFSFWKFWVRTMVFWVPKSSIHSKLFNRSHILSLPKQSDKIFRRNFF